VSAWSTLLRRTASGAVPALVLTLSAGAWLAPGVHAHPDQRRSGPPDSYAGSDTLRVEGEFGLWVRVDDSVRVSWMTEPPAAGHLEVLVPGEPSQSFSTPEGYSHTAAFVRPSAAAVVLEYGAADPGASRHRTEIRLSTPEPPPVSVDGVDSVFVISDIHGEYDHMVRVFENAGITGPAGEWAAGRSHLVVLGDMMSRSRDVLPVLWFLYRLEKEAEASGGRVHIVLGNHEIMVMLDDLRYVDPKEMWIAEVHGTDYASMFDPRSSLLGRWLISKPAMIRVNDVLMAHGGVSSDYLAFSVEAHRDSLATFSQEDLFLHWADDDFWDDPANLAQWDSASVQRRTDFFWGERSVFWYRGYAQSDMLGDELAAVLDHYSSRLHVVGHTPMPTIRHTYGDSLIVVNTVPFAAELLLLVRRETDGGHDRFSIGFNGPPRPLSVEGDPNFVYRVADIERLLVQEPLRVLDMAQARPLIDGDRSAQVLIEGEDGMVMAVKWKPVAPPGDGFNNEPRYELAAYQFQKLFLDEPEYVVPPTVLRAVPLEGYEGLRAADRPTIRGTGSRLFLLSHWLQEVTNLDPFDETRFEWDPVYARHWGNVNILTHLINHRDANVGNLLISTDPENPRVFAVDNDVAFRSRASDLGDRWSRLLVDRLPRHTVQRLRTLTREDLDAQLGVVAEFEIVDGYLYPVDPGENLDPGRGVRVTDDRVQFGLTSRDIQDVWNRLERLLSDVDRGRLTTF
jgi:hypothetical protein